MFQPVPPIADEIANKHRDENHGADDQHEPVQPLLLSRNIGDSRGQVSLQNCRSAGQIIDRVSSGAQHSARPNAQRGEQ